MTARANRRGRPAGGFRSCRRPARCRNRTPAESVLLLFSDQPLQADFCFCLADDSMSGARILAGDYVFVKRQNDVADGEIAAVDTAARSAAARL